MELSLAIADATKKKKSFFPSPLNECEKRFIEWGNYHEIKWIFFDQRVETFARVFQGQLKRTDFQLILATIGNVLVDVKERNLSSFFTFTIDEQEVQKLKQIQYLYDQDVWIVFSTRMIDFRTWYWVHLCEILNLTRLFRRSDQTAFRAVPIQDCIMLGWNDSIDIVYKKWLGRMRQKYY